MLQKLPSELEIVSSHLEWEEYCNVRQAFRNVLPVYLWMTSSGYESKVNRIRKKKYIGNQAKPLLSTWSIQYHSYVVKLLPEYYSQESFDSAWTFSDLDTATCILRTTNIDLQNLSILKYCEKPLIAWELYKNLERYGKLTELDNLDDFINLLVLHCSKEGNSKVLLQVLELPVQFEKEKLNIAFVLACRVGHLEIVEHFLKMDIDINYRLDYASIGGNSSPRKSGLVEAARTARVDVVELLVKQQELVIAPMDLTHIYTNCNFNDKVFNILFEDGRFDWYENDYSVLANLTLISFTTFEKLSLLLKDFKTHSKGIFNRIYNNRIHNVSLVWKCYKILEDALDESDLLDKSNQIITNAAKCGHVDILNEIKRLNIPVSNETANEAFVEACAQGMVSSAKLLLEEYNADVNSRARFSRDSALIAAGKRAQPSTIAFLLEQENLLVEPSALYHITKAFVNYTHSSNIHSVILQLMKDPRFRNWNDSKYSAFLQLCYARCVEEVEALLDTEGFDHSVYMQTAISIAIEKRCLGLAKVLLANSKAKSFIDIGNALRYAIRTNSIEFVNYLIQNSLVDVRNYIVWSQLADFAILEGHVELWRSLKHYGDYSFKSASLLQQLFSKFINRSQSWKLELYAHLPKHIFPLLLLKSSEDHLSHPSMVPILLERVKIFAEAVQTSTNFEFDRLTDKLTIVTSNIEPHINLLRYHTQELPIFFHMVVKRAFCSNPDIERQLLVSTKKNIVLTWACRYNLIELAKDIINNPNFTYQKEQHPFLEAMYNSNIELTQYLLEKLDHDIADRRNLMIRLACKHSTKSYIDYLLTLNTDPTDLRHEAAKNLVCRNDPELLGLLERPKFALAKQKALICKEIASRKQM
ncbi:hypothetical protein HDV04_001174 [Boothiomyces sp. JEL0838]|nr:hypothetical protein HDV04_001174 [Boothiomyces sp. JEL0838]